jgi:4-coumarate--CoA ligase
MPRYNVVDYLQYLDLYKITFMPTVPTILASIIKQPHPSRFNLTSIEGVVSGGAPLNVEMAEIFAKKYLRPDAQVRQGLGMTECTCSVLGFALDDEDAGKSVGWLHANCRAKIFPLQDRDFGDAVPRGIVAGELWIAGPNIMKGYFKNADETAKSIVYEDGHRWLRTGDIAYFDDHGRCYVIDRLKVRESSVLRILLTFRRHRN